MRRNLIGRVWVHVGYVGHRRPPGLHGHLDAVGDLPGCAILQQLTLFQTGWLVVAHFMVQMRERVVTDVAGWDGACRQHHRRRG